MFLAEEKKRTEEEAKKREEELVAKQNREKLRATLGGGSKGLSFTFEEPTYDLNKPIAMTLSMY